MQICKKCGEILQLDYEQCPFCGEQLKESNDSEASDALHEKIKQEQKKEHDEEIKAMLETHVKYRKLGFIFGIAAVLSPFIAYFFVVMLGYLKALIGFAIFGCIAAILFIYFDFIKGGARCPYCNTLLGRSYGAHCRFCGKELPSFHFDD